MSIPETLAPVPAGRTRRRRKTITGIVTSDKMQKTRAVSVTRLERHAKYGKYIRRHSTYKAHDENEVSKAGDTVVIAETRPLSKTKRWRIVKVVSKSRLEPELGAVDLGDTAEVLPPSSQARAAAEGQGGEEKGGTA